ncbi:MAG: hypothetical protein EA396_00170 [Anaerolineaceae bacterium]|nr:MAG: hypothetical protein EA396_00170 [Anaerolineaceae bacterium]
MTTVELPEWGDAFLPDVSLSEDDQRLAQTLHGVEIREMRDGLYIKASSWIGVVRFEAFVLRIRPKLINIDIMRMLLIAGGLDRLKRYRAKRDYELRDTNMSLFDLVALLLADTCTIIARDGLLHGYIVEEDDLPVVRGRLRFTDQIRRRYGQVNRLECRYDDHHANVIENRILHTALALCRRYVQHPIVRNRIQRLLDTFSAVSQPLEQNWQAVRADMTYNRLNARYKEAHALAWIILAGLNAKDVLAAGNFRGFAFLLDMNPLFEKFVEVLVRHVLRHEPIEIQAQLTATGHIWDAERNQAYKRLRPDLLLTTASNLSLVIDAKYKRYDAKKLHEGDIYQTFLYTYAFRNAEAITLPSALILYPADLSSTSVTRLHVRDNRGVVQARLHAFGIDIPPLLDDLVHGTEQVSSTVRDTIRQLLH